MVKIAIIGTFSTGKTTLTKDLCSKIKGAVEINENVRAITKKILKKKSVADLTPPEYLKLQKLLFKYQKNLIEKTEADVIIVDSAFSQFIYLTCYSFLNPNLNYVYDKLIFDYWEKINAEEVKLYDYIIYCPNILGIIDDGFRPINYCF